MRITCHLSVLLTAGLCCLCRADAPAPVPTPAQLRQTFDAGDYRGTLAGIARALALRPGADEGYDRYELLMMKGECLVQLGSGALAADAFEDAREATKDVKLASSAKASELMLRRALTFKYVPKTGAERAPIDVKPADGRRKGMMALRADLIGQHKSKLEAAARADNLEPLLTLMPVLREVAVLELGATGELAQSRPMLVELGTHARALIIAELRRCHQEVEALNAAAAEIQGYGDFVGRRGLYSKERKELAGMAEYVRRIEATAREGRRIARLLGGAADAWEQIVADSSDLLSRIDIILKRPD